MKKILLYILIVSFSTSTIVTPLRAQALWGMGDVTFDSAVFPQEVAQTIGQVSQIVDMVKNTLKTFGLDVVIYKVSQKMSQKLLTKVLNKANGGASGDDSKLFVENFGQYFEDITNQQIGQFTNFLDNSSNPFSQGISQGISNQLSGAIGGIGGGSVDGQKSFLESFSLDKALPSGVDWKDAAQDISVAGGSGWDFYQQIAMPQNSPLGAAIIAQDELVKKINSAQEVAKTELQSSGFKPDKEAKAPSFADSGSTNESFSNVNFSGKITTPKDTQEKTSEQTVTESFDRLRNADTFGKILFSTIQQMVTGLIQKGFSSLGSDGGSSGKLYGGPGDVNKIVSSSGSTRWNTVPQQVVDLRSELDLGIQKTEIEIKSLQDTIDSVKKPLSDSTVFSNGSDVFKGTILSLEACIPGPDTGYEQRLQDYATKQIKGAERFASNDNEKGTAAAEAINSQREVISTALLETKLLVDTPFLNLPGATGMKLVLSAYYKNARNFRSLINTLIVKQQVLNSLLVIQSEATAQSDAVLSSTTTQNPAEVPLGQCPASLRLNNTHCSLLLTDKQWSKLTGPEKNAFYVALTPKLLIEFPEYLTDSTDQNDLINQTTTTTGNQVSLKALPLDPDERDAEMKKRIMDHQWHTWENLVPNEQRSPLYARYWALTQDISDSASAQKAQLLAESTLQQYNELKETLDDCIAIRNHLLANPNATIQDEAFISSLKSTAVKNSYRGPSVLTAADNNVDFTRLNQGILQSSQQNQGGGQVPNTQLQVPLLPETAATVIAQDASELLFCRLSNNSLHYWTVKAFHGEPIGCNSPGPSISGNSTTKTPKANWYRTNNAEILFNVAGDN